MALDERDGAGPETEDGKSQEPGVITTRNILESFTESQEVRGLIGSLKGVFGDLVAREMAMEKFIGKHIIQRERVLMSLKRIYCQERTQPLILD